MTFLTRLTQWFKQRFTQGQQTLGMEATMADTHSVSGLTDAQLAHLNEHYDARTATLSAEIDARIAAAIAPLTDKIAQLEAAAAATVKYGEAVSLKADAGQFICAENGGPSKEKEAFKLTSRSTNTAWESFLITKGSQ